MSEREQYNLAMTAAETMYMLWELESKQREPDLDAMMRRLKDLSAYTLTHAEALDQQEGVEMLALGMFFGMSSDQRYWDNQKRLQGLSQDTLEYSGQAKVIEQEVKKRSEEQQDNDRANDEPQLRLL